MKYAIVENEFYARESLKRIIASIRPEYELVVQSESVEDTVATLGSRDDIDLIFMDVELVDGNCFEIFRKVKVEIPVIFTTAYNEFAIQAFSVNSVDYILKPVSEQALEDALCKFERHYTSSEELHTDYAAIAGTFAGRRAKSRILTVSGDNYSFVDTSNIAFFLSEDKYVYLFTSKGERRLTEYQNLNDVEADIDRNDFFRLSRSVVAGISSIISVKKHFNGRLKVFIVSGKERLEIIVSAARKESFLQWFGGGR